MLILAYLLDEYKDEEPLPLTDLRKVENITEPNYSKLYDVYFKETGHTANRTEKYYINWLELQATKFLILKQDDSSSQIDMNYPDEEKQMQDY